jgi:DNA-binding transcriptional MerR regulator
MAEELTISETSRQYGVTYRTLRHYEDQGLLRPRREGKLRLYSKDLLNTLDMIMLGKTLGFSLAKIREIVVDNENTTVDNENTTRIIDFAHLLSDHKILKQLEFLENRRSEIDKAITKLRSYLDRS